MAKQISKLTDWGCIASEGRECACPDCKKQPKPPRPRCPCGEMTIDDCAGECGRPEDDRRIKIIGPGRETR